MLRRNIDTKQGLVNGAIGTVTFKSSQQLIVKFICIVPCFTVYCIVYCVNMLWCAYNVYCINVLI